MGRIDWDVDHPMEGAHRLKRRALEDARHRTVEAVKAGDPYVYKEYKGKRFWPWRVIRGTVYPTPENESGASLVDPAGEPGQGSDTVNVERP